MIRGWLLLTRARRTTTTLTALLALAVVEYILGDATVHLFGQELTLAVPWAVVVPAAAAAVIGVGTRTATADLEESTTWSVPLLRAAHLLLLLTVGLLTTIVGSLHLHGGPISGPAAVRNYLGLTGLALLSAAAAGSAMAWPAPVALAIAAVTVGASQGIPHAWAVPIQPDHDRAAASAALIALVLGAVLVVLRGPRDAQTEAG